MPANPHTEHRPGPSLPALLVCLGLGALAAIAHYLGHIHWLIGSTKAAAANKPALDYWLLALAPLALYIFRRLAFICLAIWLLYQGTQFAAAAGWTSPNEALWALLIGGFLILLVAVPKLTPTEIEQRDRDHERHDRDLEEHRKMYMRRQRQAEIFRRSSRGL